MKRRWIWWASALAVCLLVTGVGLAEQAAEDAGDGDAAATDGGEPAADGAPSPEDEARRALVVAEINKVKVTVADFEDRLNKQGPFRRAQYGTPEKRREFLDQMISWELQSQEARTRDYDDDPAVREQVKRVMSSLLLRREVDERVRPEQVTEEEMRAYYDENLRNFKRPERVRAYHIVISDRTKAQTLLDRVTDDEVDTREFRRLAREMSEDPVTKRRGGDLRYFTRVEDRAEDDPEVHEAIVSATFELLALRQAAQKRAGKAPPPAKAKAKGPVKAGDRNQIPGFSPVYSKLVETPQGFHIIRFMGYREAVNREFEAVERQLRNRIWREKLQKARESFIAGLREEHQVEVNEDHLELVKVDLSPLARRPSPVKSSIRPKRMPGPPPRKRGPRGRPHQKRPAQ